MIAVTALAAFSPILLSTLVILWGRRSATVGALAGGGLAVALVGLMDAFTWNAATMKVAAFSTVVLTSSAALVIIPGLYLNTVLRGQGIVDGLTRWIQTLPLDSERKALVLLLGPLPAVESLTGFGVSLFLGVPIFFRLFSPNRAFRLSLLGMNIMPWGTLALATLIAASLSGLPVTPLGAATALTSSLVFPCIGLLALAVLGGGTAMRRHATLALGLGLGLSVLLFGFSRIGLTEIAGILAGMIVGFVGFVLLKPAKRGKEGMGAPQPAIDPPASTPQPPIDAPSPARLLAPYGAVLGLILLCRLDSVSTFFAQTWVLDSGRVRFAVLGSPGWALAIVALVLACLRPVPVSHRAVWSRARAATTGILCFVLLAQTMLETGMIASIATLIKGNGSGWLLSFISPALGAISGFTTGSNVGGNALMTVIQHEVGASAGRGLLLTAMQNSAAGHAVFASLPIIILVSTIARDSGYGMDIPEHELLRFGLKALVCVLIALMLSGIAIQLTGAIGSLVAQ